MADYQVVCTRKSAPTAAKHQHVVSIGIGAGGTYSVSYIVEEVYRLMNAGHRFYTLSPVDGTVAYIRALYCCGMNTLAMSTDAGIDYLANLGPCA
jgi:hypothetical protein